MAQGVEVRGSKIRIYFRYQGKLHREPLDAAPTPEGIARAAHMAALIRHEIDSGTFDFARWFPDSATAQEKALGTWLDTWLQTKDRQIAPITMAGYSGLIERYIRPRWGDTQVERIDSVALETWISKDLARLSSKTIKDTVSVLRQVFRLYRSRYRGAPDPTDSITVRLPDRDPPDPFTREEIAAILSEPTPRAQEIHLGQWLLWTGTRVSEAIALAWEDVLDLDKGLVRIRRAKVRGRYRVTKTRGSTRTLELLRPAHEALLAQVKLSSEVPPESIKVLQRDNRTLKMERLRPVFRNSNTGRSFHDDFRFRDCFWRTHLAHAGVRYRGPGQARHTFASQLLTAGVPTEWIIQQMGHTSERMFRDRYAAWITADATDMRSLVERKLGF